LPSCLPSAALPRRLRQTQASLFEILLARKLYGSYTIERHLFIRAAQRQLVQAGMPEEQAAAVADLVTAAAPLWLVERLSRAERRLRWSIGLNIATAVGNLVVAAALAWLHFSSEQ
jgi:hypothetical protein